ncbi:cytochrome P450 [Alicyclobacillus ferrooxydans]|uniref:Cytochrome n=1 Tax=Alicyclobacillus ferrooxydans TaxID=471514 RepID=A0A0P9C8Y0_9BACL|nr:cytochrome P450 [Alicyclobacillus ferrooxydans]KPV41790.1 cytochrome [Alicyclobacillus ferrooxydans]
MDMFSPQLRMNPYPVYHLMRQAQPVMYMEQMHIWSVFRYADVRTVLSDYARFSSQYGQSGVPDKSASAEARHGSSLITTDPPRHTKLRSLVNRAFTPRAVEALEPRIKEIAHELIDQIVERGARSLDGPHGSHGAPGHNSVHGTFDLVEDFSYPLPVIVIAELLGVPSSHRKQFKEWSDVVVASADNMIGGSNPDSGRVHQEMAEYFHHIMAERRQEPKDDLISALLAAEEDNEHLSEADILSFCWLLLVAGNETTTNLIGNAVRTLLEHPDQYAMLTEDRSLIPGALEETLRYRSPVQAMFRVTTEDVTLADRTIPAGERVIAWIGSANRDEERFAQADRFDITRNPNPHIAFGHGVHFCLGAPLARLEARVALETILDRLPNLSRINDDPLEPARGFIVHGVTSLPLKFA